MTTEQLTALREELRTQDNACTAHPLYCVYDHLTGRRNNWRFITSCLTKKAAERYVAEVQPLRAGTGRALPCRCRCGAVEVINGKTPLVYRITWSMQSASNSAWVVVRDQAESFSGPIHPRP